MRYRLFIGSLIGALATICVAAPAWAQGNPQPPAQQVVPQQPRAPFPLDPAEQDYVAQVLTAWEQKGDTIKTYKVNFDHWVYKIARDKDLPLYKNRGQLSYSKPDKGSLQETDVTVWNGAREAPQWNEDENAVGEHYVCTGDAVYIFDHRGKQLIESPIPEELQGQAIVNSPLPFLFAAKADDLRERYWIRPTRSTSPDQIWLDVRPKHAADAADYRQVEVILNQRELLPEAIQVYRPNGDRDVYMFGKANINGLWAQIAQAFQKPRLPFGWERVIHDPNAQQAAPQTGNREARQLPPQRTRY